MTSLVKNLVVRLRRGTVNLSDAKAGYHLWGAECRHGLSRPSPPGSSVLNDPSSGSVLTGAQLGRTLASRHLSMISIGGIIGAGLFVGSSASIAAVGPAVTLSYAIAGILVLLVMRMLGEMAVALPSIQSFADFVRVGLGPRSGFTVGWLYWFFWILVVPVEAIAGANILRSWLPLPAWLIGPGLVAIMTSVNLISARSF